MDPTSIRRLLEQFRRDDRSLDEVMAALRELPFADLGFATVDHHRELRSGFPEVIYGEGKTLEQLVSLFGEIGRNGQTVLATRIGAETGRALVEALGDVEYEATSRTALLRGPTSTPNLDSPIGLVTAGTSDLPIAEEAAVTAEAFGHSVLRVYDVGVAGPHRLLMRRAELDEAKILIVIAGMEGALASFAAGLTAKPVIAVPTSVGYGASFGWGSGAARHVEQLCCRGDGREHRQRLRRRAQRCHDQPRVRGSVMHDHNRAHEHEHEHGSAQPPGETAHLPDGTLPRGAGLGKTLFVDAFSGIAGDMFVAALLDLGVPRTVIDDAIAALPVEGYTVHVTAKVRSGISARHFSVRVEEGQASA